MIYSEEITFTIKTYGAFKLTGDGLEFISVPEGAFEDLIPTSTVDSFNDIYADMTHLTPIEALSRVDEHFVVPEDFIGDVKITNRKPIESPTENKIF